jgi:cobalt-zinc-cadmium efflux system membrane fusion protein
VKQLADTGEVNPRYVVRAPIDGQVVRREVTLGEVVGPDMEALLTLADLNTLWVIADVPEKRLPGVVVGSPATISCDGINKTTLEGKVAYIAPELDKETRTGQIRIEIQGGAEGVNPGMFTQVHLSLRDGQVKDPGEVIAVPEAAVQTFEGGPTVFIEAPNEPSSFIARRVETGPSNGEMVPILSGLEEGTRIVVEGAFIVKAELVKGEMEGKTCSGH